MNIFMNTLRALKDQGPFKRFLKNLVTLRLRGVIKPRSCKTREGKPKVGYGHKESADRAKLQMGQKTGKHYSSYKCFFCPKYHIGANGVNNSLPE